MSNETNTPADTPVDSDSSANSVDEDLDTFSAAFFQTSEDTKDNDATSTDSDKKTEEVDTTGEDNDTSPATETTDSDDDGDDTDNSDGESEDEPEDEENHQPHNNSNKPKGKKNRFQERIDELTNARREAERKAAALEERLAKLENPEPSVPPQPQDSNKKETVEGPTPNDQLEDGTEKYPLGEFDPQYIRDLTKFTIEQERQADRLTQERERQERAVQEQRNSLVEDWNKKLEPARERYPDFQEKGQELISSFDGIEPAYGEYLSTTIMSMDYGTDVLYYLASNPDEAAKIVNSGPAKATVALGRIEARFIKDEEEAARAKKVRTKVSNAPEPPAHLNKGSSMAKAEVEDDTDDLDAFARKFFKASGRR